KEEGVFIPKKFAPSLPFIKPTQSIVMENVLQVENITFNRKNTKILDGVNLEINAGSFVSIVGKNGSGKSTLLEIMAGVLQPNSGQVSMHGKPLHKWAEGELRKKMGFVFQNPEHQFITDTVYDEI